jgi:hypothetical protein
MKLFLYDQIPSNRTAFASKVVEISQLLGINPDWLMLVMYFESKLNSAAKNPGSSATGLIQFLEATANELGTTTAKLAAMTNVQQLDFVYRYLYRYKSKLKSVQDVYLAVFYPAAMAKDLNYILPFSPRTVELNKIFDRNQDKKITVGEIRDLIVKYGNDLAKKFNYQPSQESPENNNIVFFL